MKRFMSWRKAEMQEKAGMGTTLVAVTVDGILMRYVANVGDQSRLSIFR